MMKQSLLVLAAAGLISIAAPFATAQDNPSNNQPSAQEHGRWHGHEDPAQRTAELTKKLKLTFDQQTKVQDALQSEHSQMESLHQDSSLSQQDRRAKMTDIRKTTDGQIRGLLDADQQKKWDDMQAQREQRMQNRNGGPPNGGSGAPPQQ